MRGNLSKVSWAYGTSSDGNFIRQRRAEYRSKFHVQKKATKPPATAVGFVVVLYLRSKRSVVAAKPVVDANPHDVVVECNVVARRKASDRRRCKIGVPVEPHVEIFQLYGPGMAERVLNAAARGPTGAG